jgi:hypothetical protein
MEEVGINAMQNDVQPVLGYVLSEVGQLGGRYEHNLIEPAQELRIQQFGCDIRGLVKSRHSSDIRQAGELQEVRKKLPRVLTVEKVDNVVPSSQTMNQGHKLRMEIALLVPGHLSTADELLDPWSQWL